jgi:ketosteroid isomerase-like protein
LYSRFVFSLCAEGAKSMQFSAARRLCVRLKKLTLPGAFSFWRAAMKMPELKRQRTPQAVVDEHLDALNRGNWERLMAQYPPEVEIFLPNGVTIRGREQVGEAFREMVKPFAEGGLLGVTFTPEHVFAIGDTVNVQWRVDADFLREPYRGADAYITGDGLMAVQVSTFDYERLKSYAR